MFLLSALKEATWLNQKRAVAYPIIFLCVYGFVIALWISGSSIFPKHDGVEFSRDFANVYAAGQAVHEGKAADAYVWEHQKEREHQLERSGEGPNPIESYVPWIYPPMFLAVAWLVAFVPYYYALAGYLIFGAFAYGAAVYKLVGFRKSVWAIAAFPAVWSNLFAGQNGFITTALLGAGLFFLDASPVVAGLFFGVLSYKPQFFMLIPLVLLVGRHWRALFSTMASAATCAAFSFAAFGVDAWTGFLQGLPAAQATILENATERWLGIMHTVYSAVRMYGGNIQSAYAAQTAVAIAAVLVLVLIWARRPSLAVRGASLVAALLLASPYSFGYDQVVLAVPIALLAREGAEKGFYSFEKVFLFLLWLLPAFVKDMGENYALPLTPPMLIALMAICWRRGMAQSHLNH